MVRILNKPENNFMGERFYAITTNFDYVFTPLWGLERHSTR